MPVAPPNTSGAGAGAAAAGMTVDQLRTLATSALTAAADATARAGARAAVSRDLFAAQVLGPVTATVDWTNGGQQAAAVEVRDTHHRAAQIPSVLHAAAPIVRTWAADLAAAQAALTRLQTRAALHGLTITPAGNVEPAAGALASALEKITDPDDDVASDLRARVHAVLTEATAVDQACARHLLALLPTNPDGTSPWHQVAAAVLAPTSVSAPANRPAPPGAGYGSGAGSSPTGGRGGGAGGSPSRPGGSLTNFFRRLFKPNGPWKAPRPGNRWTGSGKTTEELYRAGQQPMPPSNRAAKTGRVPPPEKRLTQAGHSMDKHNSQKRPGHEKFPNPKGNTKSKNKTAHEVLNKILSDPRTLELPIDRPGTAAHGGTYYIAPDGRGVAFDRNGNLAYFGVFDYPG